MTQDVAQVLSEGTYDLPLFLSYLKSFTISGEQPEREILLGILMQSLSRFHTSDFTACMCLVSAQVQQSASVEREINYIYALENLLSCGDFANFWQQWTKVKGELPESFNFETRTRTSILEVISFTTGTIPLSTVARYLGVPENQVGQAVQNAKSQGGELECEVGDGNLVFGSNAFNTPKANVYQESIKFKDVLKVVR
ncbi:translation initiation factor 3 subunit K [Angomonas deanei]|uniref:CSN8/PSMD8/EIF3K family, putative n=1 Tax=Angomonas deanei TaxID=59799 RepID=S9VCR3_9TRYP|nr:translation initiation factor 3 subunit K [Angomonas deanei]EPY40702.1 translation initiation factor 3 subunit K [Angomonas deanei]CAD2216201.1 CSN8/PSMD8/EIF3K family, putative [Angomonas deanei]|eukprot:EPY40600.1 translation initiation factor 3 subunit K [Angomonas deanei]